MDLKLFLLREKTYGPMICKTFQNAGLPPSWGMAIAAHESGFKPDATNLTGGDLVRGGSYGLFQMSFKTATEDLGFTGKPTDLLRPELNARLAATYCAKLVKQVRATDIATIAAAYNCGPTHVNHKTIPKETAEDYVPDVVKRQADYVHFDTRPFT